MIFDNVVCGYFEYQGERWEGRVNGENGDGYGLSSPQNHHSSVMISECRFLKVPEYEDFGNFIV